MPQLQRYILESGRELVRFAIQTKWMYLEVEDNMVCGISENSELV